jgi:hypothetical protein
MISIERWENCEHCRSNPPREQPQPSIFSIFICERAIPRRYRFTTLYFAKAGAFSPTLSYVSQTVTFAPGPLFMCASKMRVRASMGLNVRRLLTRQPHILCISGTGSCRVAWNRQAQEDADTPAEQRAFSLWAYLPLRSPRARERSPRPLRPSSRNRTRSLHWRRPFIISFGSPIRAIEIDSRH